MSDDRRCCAFRVGQDFLGVEAARVQEAAGQQATTRVLLAPLASTGLINLRAQILTTIDLRRSFGLPARPVGRGAKNVLITTPERPTSLQVVQIDDVAMAASDSLEAPPEALDAGVRRLIQGVSNQDGRLLLLPDADKALNLAV